MLNNDVKARKINDKGDYEKIIKGVNLIDSQNYFMDNDLKRFWLNKRMPCFE